MATELTTEEQHELIHQGIVALAGHCDGAQAKDFQGFNGVDTHFGRRVAGVARDQWTPEVFDECAHIILKYREQVMAYTGTDVATLPLVIAAQDQGTNYTARNQARGYERLAEALKDRKVDVVEGKLGIFYGKRDPDFSLFLGVCKALPGRKFDWDRKCNVVPVSPEAQAFIQEYDFPVTDAARGLLEAPRPAAPVHYDIWLQEGRIIIKTNLTAPGQPASDAIRSLPGRSFVRSLYANSADPTPQVLAFAHQFNLAIHPDAVRACEAAQAALQATHASDLAQADLDTVLNAVSRCGSPEELPEAFVLMLKDILP